MRVLIIVVVLEAAVLSVMGRLVVRRISDWRVMTGVWGRRREGVEAL